MSATGYDYDTGFGKVNALDAEYKLFTPQTPTLLYTTDNGQFNFDRVTSVTSQIIRTYVPANSFIQLFKNGSPFMSYQNTSGATAHDFSFTATQNTVASYTIKVKSSSSVPDANYSNSSPAITIYTDALANAHPSTAPDLAASSDTGQSNSDNITTNGKPTFVGNVDAGAAGALVTLWASPFLMVGSQQLAAGATAYSITVNTFSPLSAGIYAFTIRTQQLGGAPPTSYYDSPSLSVTIDDGTAPVATITQVTGTQASPRYSVPGNITITFNKPVYNFTKSDLTLTRDGGSNRIPWGSLVNVTSTNATTWQLVYTDDIAMSTGKYDLSIISGNGIKSVAGNVTAAAAGPMEWWQGDKAYQNGGPTEGLGGIHGLYNDVTGDGYVVSADALAVINAVNGYGSQTLPGTVPPPFNPYFYDVSGDGVLSSVDSLIVINYINAGYGSHPPGFAPIGAGDVPPADLRPTEVTANVVLQATDLSGSPITSIKSGQQFQLQVLLVLNAPSGVQPVAGYADVSYPALLVSPASSPADVGLVGSTVSGGVIDEAGRAMYGDATGLMLSKTFTAAKKGTATFTADAADLFGHEIYVSGLSEALPLSQVTFGSTTLTIK